MRARPSWPVAFVLERRRLLEVVPGAFLAIEHVGSTAVPGLVAKPIIDLMAAVESLDAVDALIARLWDHGDTTSNEFTASLIARISLVRRRNGHRTHQLHIVVGKGAPWNDLLALRDALRSDSALAQRYAELKTTLAVKHRTDREAHGDAKSAFIDAVVLPTRQR